MLVPLFLVINLKPIDDVPACIFKLLTFTIAHFLSKKATYLPACPVQPPMLASDCS